MKGVLLRYLSDVYRGLVRNIPEDLKTDELLDVTEWLGELVRQVDSSLIDEWERLAAAAALAGADDGVAEIASEFADVAPTPAPVTSNHRAFRVMVRNAAFRRVELVARRDVTALADAELAGGLDAAAWANAVEAYYSMHSSVGTGQEARAAAWLEVVEGPRIWSVRQGLDDPEGWHDNTVVAEVDLDASDEAGSPAWRTLRVEHG